MWSKGRRRSRNQAQPTNINQSSTRAVINWQGFSVGRQETVNFNQPSAAAATLNRVTGNERSVINGAINANGQVFIVNSAGILFGGGAQVNVGGLVASTLNITDQNFMAGNYMFEGSTRDGVTPGSVINRGHLHARGGGYISLLGHTVVNDGVITATLGTVAMASGEKITLNFGGDSLVDATIDTGTFNALVANHRLTKANGGTVIMTAKAADQVLSAQVNNSGIIEARSMSALKGGQGEASVGRIELVASGGSANVSGKLVASSRGMANGGKVTILAKGGSASVSGKIDTSSAKASGGSVTVTGTAVDLMPTAVIAANGATGGTILIGGDRHGGSDAGQDFVSYKVYDATTVTVEQGALLSANGGNGNGGNVVVWSNEQTNYGGRISATGVGTTGNGGFAEVSSADQLNFAGTANLTSAHGTAGTLLLDPYDVMISNTADSNSANASGTFTGSGDPSVINATTLLTALESANVTISTGAVHSAGAGAGDININSALDWSSTSATPSTHSLTLAAANNVNVNAPVTWSAGTLTLTAGADIYVNAVMTATGTANFAAHYGYVIDANGNATTSVTGNGFNADGVTPYGLYTLQGVTSAGTYAGKINFAGTGTVVLNRTQYTVVESASDIWGAINPRQHRCHYIH